MAYRSFIQCIYKTLKINLLSIYYWDAIWYWLLYRIPFIMKISKIINPRNHLIRVQWAISLKSTIQSIDRPSSIHTYSVYIQNVKTQTLINSPLKYAIWYWQPYQNLFIMKMSKIINPRKHLIRVHWDISLKSKIQSIDRPSSIHHMPSFLLVSILHALRRVWGIAQRTDVLSFAFINIHWIICTFPTMNLSFVSSSIFNRGKNVFAWFAWAKGSPGIKIRSSSWMLSGIH